jgi:hypothetical protein
MKPLHPEILSYTFFFICKACFRQNITVVTIYASLGEEALCHSLSEVSTVTCLMLSLIAKFSCDLLILVDQDKSVRTISGIFSNRHEKIICSSCMYVSFLMPLFQVINTCLLFGVLLCLTNLSILLSRLRSLL